MMVGAEAMKFLCLPMQARPATTQMTYLSLSNFEMDPFVAAAAAGCEWQKKLYFYECSSLLG